MEQDRSLGVSIISGFEMAIGWLMTLLSSAIQIFNIISTPVVWVSEYQQGSHEVGIMAGYVAITVFSLILLAGIFTFALHKVGRILNLFLSSCCILVHIVWFSLSSKEYFFKFLFSFAGLVVYTPLILSIIFIWYFTRPDVEDQFK